VYSHYGTNTGPYTANTENLTKEMDDNLYVYAGVTANTANLANGNFNTVTDNGGALGAIDTVTLTNEFNDTVNLGGTYEELTLDDSKAATIYSSDNVINVGGSTGSYAYLGYGSTGNTINVSGGTFSDQNTVYDASGFLYGGNTINVAGGSAVTVKGDYAYLDSVVATGNDSLIYASNDQITLSNDVSFNTVFGNDNTITVDTSAYVYAAGTFINVDMVYTTTGELGYGNYIFGTGNQVALNGEDSINYVDATGVNLTVGGADATVYLYGTAESGSGGNTVTVNSGTNAWIYDNTVGASNTIYVTNYSTAFIYTPNGNQDTVNIDGGTAYLYGAGGNTVNIYGYSENWVYEYSKAGNTITVSDNYSTLHLYGPYSSADTVTLSGHRNDIFANDDYIEVATSAYSNEIIGAGNTLVTDGDSKILKPGNEIDGGFALYTSPGILEEGLYYAPSGNVVFGYGNGVTIEGVGSTTYVYAQGLSLTVGQSATVDIYSEEIYIGGEDGLEPWSYSGGNTITVDAHNTFEGANFNENAAYINDHTGDNAINLIGGSWASVYASNDVINVGGTSDLYLRGYAGDNQVNVNDGTRDFIGEYSFGYGLSNTINVSNDSGAYIYVYNHGFEVHGDTINVSGGSYVDIWGSGAYRDTIVEFGTHNVIYSGTSYVSEGYSPGNYIEIYGRSSSVTILGDGGNTIVTAGNYDGLYSRVYDASWGANTINVFGGGGLYITTYGQGDRVNIGTGSWAELYGDGGNTVDIYDTGGRGVSTWFYDDSTGANTVNLVDAEAAIVSLNGNGKDTINMYDSQAFFYGTGGNTINLLGEDPEAFIYEKSTGGNTINLFGDSELELYGSGVRNDTVVVSGGFNDIYANDAYIEMTEGTYANNIYGNGNTIAIGYGGDGQEVALYDGNIYVYGEGRIAAVYHKGGNSRIYDNSNAISVVDDSYARVTDFSLAGSQPMVANVTGYSAMEFDNLYANGDTIGVGGYSMLWLEGAGGDTITVGDGTSFNGEEWNRVDDLSSGGNTINVTGRYSGVYADVYFDTVNIAGNYATSVVYGGYNRITLSNDATLDLKGEGQNIVTVAGGDEWAGSINDESYKGSVYANTINVVDGGVNIYTGYTQDGNVYSGYSNDDTINMSDDSFIDLSGSGGNTVVVHGYNFGIDDWSEKGNTINLVGDSRLYLYGESSSMDTVVVSGWGNELYGKDHYIEMNGDAGLSLYDSPYGGGGGNNTIVVSGTDNAIYNYSHLTSAVELASGAQLGLEGSNDTITAVSGAVDNMVGVDGTDLVTLNANSGSCLSIYNPSANEYVNETGGKITIDSNNTTVYVYDSSFTSGHSSDTFVVNGTNDTVKFVNAMITAAASFGITAPATLSVEDSYNGATAIGLVSHA
jgi:hypothetical protein